MQAWGGGPFLPFSLRKEIRGGDVFFGNAVWGTEKASLQRGIREAGVSLPKGAGRGDGAGLGDGAHSCSARGAPRCRFSAAWLWKWCLSVLMLWALIISLRLSDLQSPLLPTRKTDLGASPEVFLRRGWSGVPETDTGATAQPLPCRRTLPLPSQVFWDSH